MSAEDKAEVSFTWGLGALPRFGEFGGMRLELEEYQELPSSTLRHAGVSPTPPPVPMPTAPSERPPALDTLCCVVVAVRYVALVVTPILLLVGSRVRVSRL